MSSPTSDPASSGTPTPLTPFTRRRMLGAAAWTTPVVVVAAAAPAQAASAPARIEARPGGTRVVRDASATQFDNLRFVGATVINRGPALAAGQLGLVVTFSASTSESGTMLTPLRDIAGWDGPPAGGGITASTLSYTYRSAVAAGATVTVPDGEPFGATDERARQQGRFVVTFFAPQAEGEPLSFATLPPQGARRTTLQDPPARR